MPRVRAPDLHSGLQQKDYLELDNLCDDFSKVYIDEPADVDDPCSMCYSCKIKRTPVKERTEAEKDRLKIWALQQDIRDAAEGGPCCLKSEEAKLLLACVCFVKASVYNNGFGGDFGLSSLTTLFKGAAACGSKFYEVYTDAPETPETAYKNVDSVLKMVASVPLMCYSMGAKDWSNAVHVAEVALKGIELEPEKWERALSEVALSLEDMELCLRLPLVVLHHARLRAVSLRMHSLSQRERRRFIKQVELHGLRVAELRPGNYLNCLMLADITKDYSSKWMIMETAMEEADKRGCKLARSLTRWELCHAILMGGNGPDFQVSRVLAVMKQARICKAAVEEHSDYEMHCHPLHYWRCLGAGARLANMVRRDPAAAAARLPAYASEAELDQELVHTMCDGCRTLSEKVLKCAKCEVATYCSKDCQKQHWKQEHKQTCGSFRKQALTRQDASRLIAAVIAASEEDSD